MWAMLSAIGLFITQYVFSQWAFAYGFFGIFIFDTITGVYIALRTQTFKGDVFRLKMLDKTVCYITIILAFSMATKMSIENSDINLIQYLNVPIYSLFIMVELRSIVLNWYKFKQWPFLGQILELIDKTKKETIDKNIKTETDE